MKRLILIMVACLAVRLLAQDPELTNYRTGIDVTWGGTKGTDYYEEYLYYDKPVYDAKVVYIKSTTPIAMVHNVRNKAFYHVSNGGNQVIGINGKDGIPNSGDEGVIRYKLDRDRQDYLIWSDNTARTTTSRVLPAYTAPSRWPTLSTGMTPPESLWSAQRAGMVGRSPASPPTSTGGL